MSKRLRLEYSLVAIMAVLLVGVLLVNSSGTLIRVGVRIGLLALLALILWLAHHYHWVETVLKAGAYVLIVLGIVGLALAGLAIALVQFVG